MGRTIVTGTAGFVAANEGNFGLVNVDINSSTAAVSNRAYWCDTSGTAFTLTLPANPVMGDTIRIIDVGMAFDTNNLTIARNGNVIMGDAANMTVSTEGAAFDLVFYNVSKGWRVFTV
jgi:hypothetical protein